MESEWERGSTFRVTLPQSASPWHPGRGLLRIGIKGRDPAITHVELQRRIEGYRQQMQDAAYRACVPR